jgi:serine-protein kinase ATM
LQVKRALLAQILDMLVYRGRLFEPVALDYAKALKAIVGFQPHMDHLEDSTWVAILQLAFNVVLRDPLRNELDDSDMEMEDSTADELYESEEHRGSTPGDVFDEQGLPSSVSEHSKKRRRTQPDTSRLTPSRSAPTHRRHHAASNEQVEFTSILLILLRARSAPLLSPDYPNLASAVLKRLQRFLAIYPAETSLHHDYLLTLSATLPHLCLNRKHDVESFARHSWPSLVDLWGTGAKSRWIKEALIPIFRTLLPFLTSNEYSSSIWREGVSKLWHLLEDEAESRWGADTLKGENDNGTFDRPFVAQTFRAGWHFDSGQALAWTILELQTDCTEKVDFVPL